MGTGSLVKWVESRETFERTVESLVQRIWSTRPDGSAFVVDGRGGDGGLDIYVSRDDKIVQVYQLKFFPEGMSGGFKAARRTQVQRSFESVATLEDLETWTLIIPRNLTVPEIRATLAMRKGRPISLEVWGQAELDQRIAAFPDLLAAATREPLVDVLRTAAMEGAALAGPNDLSERVRKLGELANGRSPYWGMDFSVENGSFTQTLVPKRPDAFIKEPIALSLSAQFTPETEGLRLNFQSMLEYGSVSRIMLPPEVVTSFRVDGPAWLASESTGGAVTFEPAPLPDKVPAELRVTSSRGAILASLPGELVQASRGLKGFTIHLVFGGLTLTIRYEVESERTNAKFSFNLAGMAPTAAQAILRATDLIGSGADITRSA